MLAVNRCTYPQNLIIVSSQLALCQETSCASDCSHFLDISRSFSDFLYSVVQTMIGEMTDETNVGQGKHGFP